MQAASACLGDGIVVLVVVARLKPRNSDGKMPVGVVNRAHARRKRTECVPDEISAARWVWSTTSATRCSRADQDLEAEWLETTQNPRE